MAGDPLAAVQFPAPYPLFVIDGLSRRVAKFQAATDRDMDKWKQQLQAVRA